MLKDDIIIPLIKIHICKVKHFYSYQFNVSTDASGTYNDWPFLRIT